MSFQLQRDFASDIADRIDGLPPITVVRFFGGVGLRCGGVQFGFVMKGSLYLRVDERSRAALEALGGAAFRYEGASASVTVTSYSEAPATLLDDDRELSRWAREAYRAALSAKARPTRRLGRNAARPTAAKSSSPRKAWGKRG